MGTKTQLNKALLDIEDCISELKRQSVDGRTPINDDSTTLHRFQEKLELILLFGLIEKPGLLAPKKLYWNYICACFTSSKRSHDGINFVKSIVALKTPLGRGRAFIRFCLTQKCLADTLQSCFMNQKISRDFYSEQSLPVQEKLWSSLVTALYELNELNFDLVAGYTELDISWPKFARKLFATSISEDFHCQNMSIPDVHCCSSQDDLDTIKLTELNQELFRQNKCLQKEVSYLEGEKLRLQSDIETLERKYLSLQQQLSKSQQESDKKEFHEVILDMGHKPTSSNFTSEVTGSDSHEKLGIETITNTLTEVQDEHCTIGPNPSVKSKTKKEICENYSDCNLQQNDQEVPISLSLHSFNTCNKNTENLKANRNIYMLQNPIYISELLLEIKTAIDDIEDAIQKADVTLAVPHILHLKRIRNCLEEKFVSEIDKSENYLNFSKLIENCITCIKNFIAQQEKIINSLLEKVDLSIKGNQNLYSKIKTLKDLLRSYGFLKLSSTKEIEPETILLPLNTSSSSKTNEDFSYDIAHDPILKKIIVPLLPILNSSFKKLLTLNEKIAELQFSLDSSQELNNNLITRVQDQEMHLKGVTKEIEEAQQLVSVLKKQHRKLQSSEGILKYDLQEKRKLLTRLRQQLENTREDFNLVRIKNSKSEAEWQDLHEEFLQRHKQVSEESGFIDDKTLENHETASSDLACDGSFPVESTYKTDLVNKDSTSETEAVTEVPTKQKRLESLEEQCRDLYSSLLQSSKKRQAIDKHLENMCKRIEKNNKIHSNIVSSQPSTEDNFEKESLNETPTEGNCESIIFPHDAFPNSSTSSSDTGCLNLGHSSCIPSTYNEAMNERSDSYDCDSSKTESCTSFLSKLQINASQLETTGEEINESNSLSDSDFPSSCKESSSVSYESVEFAENNLQLQNISHVDSILIKKKDLEECLKNLEIDDDEILSAEKKKYFESEEACEEDKHILLNKVQELEKKIVILSTKLYQTTQQLIISKAAKEHEVSALQFQLNTEALKYEKALKEFSEQSQGLEIMKQRVSEQEQLILALENTLSEIRCDQENEKEQQWQESISEAEQEHSKNEYLMSQLDELKTFNLKDKEGMEAEIVRLKRYSRQLQKKLIKLLKEKDILWKRNNDLFHLQKIKIDDRWMNDSEVSHCLGCKSTFSFMLRKHHCRICGRIFCYSCCNNWLLTASSSKKIRTCNECFMQNIEIKQVVRKGSDVPYIEDSSEDEADDNYLSLIPINNSSFSSEIPSSITDSVISLPITQKQSTPHFASAPDLRYVFKHEANSCSISLVNENVKGKEEKAANDDINELEQNTDISSDEGTSVILEDSPESTKTEVFDKFGMKH